MPEVSGASVVLQGDEAHHLSKVLRLQAGASVTLFDGRGRSADAIVTGVSKHHVDLELTTDPVQSPPPPQVTIALSPPKRDFDETITMLAELGIASVILLDSDHGEVVADLKRDRLERVMARIHKVTVAAAKQSGSDYLLAVTAPIRLTELTLTPLICDPSGPVSLHSALERSVPNSITIAIGPEGGWSQAERKMIADRGWPIVSLPGHVLRTGTAAIVASVIALQSHHKPHTGLAEKP